jgi:hypothetical protein
MLLALLVAVSPSLDGLLAQVEKAYGHARFAAVRETGTLESPRGLADTVRLFAPPDRLRVEIRYRNGVEGEVRVLAGPHAWRDGEMVQGPPRDAMLLQAARLDMPGVLLRNRGRLVDIGPASRDGKRLHWIGAPLEGNLQLAVGVDPKSGLVLRSEGQLATPGGPLRSPRTTRTSAACRA